MREWAAMWVEKELSGVARPSAESKDFTECIFQFFVGLEPVIHV